MCVFTNFQLFFLTNIGRKKEHACALLVLRNMLTEGTETNSARRRNHLALISK
jgi:hypothetical protein